MKMYETKYIFNNGWSQTNRNSSPELPENTLGDFVNITIYKDGEPITKECGIIGIEQNIVDVAGEEYVFIGLGK